MDCKLRPCADKKSDRHDGVAVTGVFGAMGGTRQELEGCDEPNGLLIYLGLMEQWFGCSP